MLPDLYMIYPHFAYILLKHLLNLSTCMVLTPQVLTC